MKITAVETVRLGEFPNLVWVRLRTDEGLTGLGETFMGAAAVEAYIHESAAPKLIGRDPIQIEAINTSLINYLGWRGTGVETRGNSAIDIALWDLFGKAIGRPVCEALGGKSRDRIRVYNTCAGYKYIRDERSQAVANWGVGNKQGPYEDLEAFLHRADELALSLLEQGITGMKIWPFDIAAERTAGWDISPAELDAALEPFAKIRKAVGNRMDIMVEFHSLWSLPMAKRLARALAPVRHLLARGSVPSRQSRRPESLRRSIRRPGCARRRRWPTPIPSASTSRPASPAWRCSTCRGAAACRRRARSRHWPKPGMSRWRRTTAPARWSMPPPAISRCMPATR